MPIEKRGRVSQAGDLIAEGSKKCAGLQMLLEGLRSVTVQTAHEMEEVAAGGRRETLDPEQSLRIVKHGPPVEEAGSICFVLMEAGCGDRHSPQHIHSFSVASDR